MTPMTTSGSPTSAGTPVVVMSKCRLVAETGITEAEVCGSVAIREDHADAGSEEENSCNGDAI